MGDGGGRLGWRHLGPPGSWLSWQGETPPPPGSWLSRQGETPPLTNIGVFCKHQHHSITSSVVSWVTTVSTPSWTISRSVSKGLLPEAVMMSRTFIFTLECSSTWNKKKKYPYLLGQGSASRGIVIEEDEDGLLNVEVGGVELLEDQPFGRPSSSTNLLQLRSEEAWNGIWLECIF